MKPVRLKTLGTAKRLEYVRNGRRYVHDFQAGVELGYFARGRALVIAPADLEGGDWISDRPAKRKPAKRKAAKRTAKRSTKRKGR